MNKAVIRKYVQYDERKGWKLLKVSSNQMKNGENLDNIRYVLQEDQFEEVAQEKSEVSYIKKVINNIN